MTSRAWLLSSVSLVTLTVGLADAAVAADLYATPAILPAVSAPNSKVGAFVGAIGNDFTLGATGSFTVPLSTRWGAQVDGLLGSAAGGTFYGVGGHLFTRDPAKGLLGAYASYTGWGTSTTLGTFPTPFTDVTGADVGKVGLEGASYLGRISLEGVAAYQFGTDTGAAGKATIAFYPVDDVRLDLSYRYLQGPGGTFEAGAEWAPAGHSISLFANAATASSTDWSALVGLKMFFGAAEKSLIRRDREDDPENMLPDDLYKSVGGAYCVPPHYLVDDRCDNFI